MTVPPALLRDRHFWKRAAVHVRTRAGVLPGEAVYDPAPGPGLLAIELARTMPRFRFLVAGPAPPGAPPNLVTAGDEPLAPKLPPLGVGLVTCGLGLDGWKTRELKRLFAALEPEIVRLGRAVILTRVPTPKQTDLPTGFLDAVEKGLLQDAGFERVEFEELEYLPDGSQLAVVHGRRPAAAADAAAEEE